MSDTFESLLVKLARARVDFLVAGGVAVCLNGYVRATQDLDLLVDHHEENLRRLLGCLETFGEGFSRELCPADFAAEEGAVRVIEDFTVDVFTLMRSHTFADFANVARELVLEDIRIRYLAPESLIVLKEPSSREKDQLDVAVLKRLIAGVDKPKEVNLRDLTPPEQN